jgi:hypothetical protein
MARPYWFSGDFKPVNLASWMIRNVPTRPLREAVQNLHGATQTFKDEREKLAAVIGSAYEQDRQLKWVLWTEGIALLVGLLISPIFARGSPFGWDGRVAAFILQADRWEAGATLMQAGNPEGWRGQEEATNLVRSNQEALAACRDAAAKAKKEQHCTLVMPAP